LTEADLPAKFGRFELQAILGQGSMGRVFRAELQGPGGFKKKAALKVMLHRDGPESEEFRRSLVREGRIGALMSHPNIVETYDLGETDEAPWISMELIEGVGLDGLLESLTTLTPAEALEVASQICDGLSYAHTFVVDGQAAKVVHRDLKPSNVILGRDGVVRIMDFGIAKAAVVSGIQTAEGLTRGTAPYMSPEQTRGKPVDGRSDVFAVGAVLFELLTGRRLFWGPTLVAVMTKIVAADATLAKPGVLEPAERRLPGVSAVLRACLRADPDARTASAADLGDQLRELRATVADRADLAALAARVLDAGTDETLQSALPPSLPDVDVYTHSPPPVQPEPGGTVRSPGPPPPLAGAPRSSASEPGDELSTEQHAALAKGSPDWLVRGLSALGVLAAAAAVFFLTRGP